MLQPTIFGRTCGNRAALRVAKPSGITMSTLQGMNDFTAILSTFTTMSSDAFASSDYPWMPNFWRQSESGIGELRVGGVMEWDARPKGAGNRQHPSSRNLHSATSSGVDPFGVFVPVVSLARLAQPTGYLLRTLRVRDGH